MKMDVWNCPDAYRRAETFYLWLSGSLSSSKLRLELAVLFLCLEVTRVLGSFVTNLATRITTTYAAVSTLPKLND